MMEPKGNEFVETSECEPSGSMIEVREELMVSPFGDSEPTLRAAHFLKPSEASTDGLVWAVPPFSESSLPSSFQPKEWPLSIKFNGRGNSLKKWVAWVEKMEPKHGSMWKKAGIFSGIMNTRYTFHRDENLLLGIAERWCPITNTFLFPWGEATITLEDVLVLGGFSVLGDTVFRQLETKELKEVEMKLLEAIKETGRSVSCKASLTAWMRVYMDSGNEFEHEAFLAAWLSLFVFYDTSLIRKAVFPMAVYLARGIPVALAPAVLASIYKDLTLLNKTIIESTKFQSDGNDVLEVVLRSPSHLIQIWAWERIESLQSTPNTIKFGDPILARWHKVQIMKVDNMRLSINSAGESFRWRPYATLAGVCCLPNSYSEKDMWVPIYADLDEHLQALALSWRCSLLVGLDCIKRYSPHRVALQFGFDQDLPVCVDWCSETQEAAWMWYIRPFGDDDKLYVPSRLFEADVTKRYSEWWKHSILDIPHDPWKCGVKRKRSSRSSGQARSSKQDEREQFSEVSLSPDFPPHHDVNFGEKVLTIKKENNDGVVPPDFPPKHNAKESENLIEERNSPVTQPGISASPIQHYGIPVEMELTVDPSREIKTEAPLTLVVSAVEEEARKDEQMSQTGEKISLNGTQQCSSGEDSSHSHDPYNADSFHLEERIVRLEREFSRLKEHLLLSCRVGYAG